jgi:GT2 family glycosyltransferase
MRREPPASGKDSVQRRTEQRPGPPKVGVVILNYNGKALAERCVQSLIDSRYPGLEIILVDNASTDGSAAYLQGLFPGVSILECPKNLGITGGRNRGLREAVARRCDYVLSLDNDAYIDARLIDELLAVAEADVRVGVVGPKVYLDDGSGRLQCAGGRITYTQNVSSERGVGEADRGQYDKVEAVDYFPGFGLMARGEVFERLDFLDDRLSGWGHDDTDFCLRAAQAGYRVVYVPRAVMWHRGSATIGVYTPEKKYLEAINSVYLVRKHGTFGNRVKYAFFAGVGLIYALVVQTPRGNHRAVFAKARGMWAGLRKPIT